MRLLLAILVLTTIVYSCHAQTTVVGKILSLDPAFDKLIDKNAAIEVLADSFIWAEGPAWVKDSNYLVFSDVKKNSIYKWKEGEGLSEFLKPSGYTGRMRYSDEPGSNGLLINSQGQLVLCEHGDRRISVMPLAGGGKRTLADNYHGKRFNSPNDIIQKSNGDYYFTDPAYGLPKDSLNSSNVLGLYRLSADGVVTLLADNMTPNGLAFSPDEKFLYVLQSLPDKPFIIAFAMKPDGTIGKGKVFFDASQMLKERPGELPDGMKTDVNGNLFTTGPGGVLVISPAGKVLGKIDTDQRAANCAWGDDGSTLYITATNLLCRIKTKTKGARF